MEWVICLLVLKAFIENLLDLILNSVILFTSPSVTSDNIECYFLKFHKVFKVNVINCHDNRVFFINVVIIVKVSVFCMLKD